VHEASIALAIVDEICDRSAAAGVESISAVNVRIGALSSVVPDALRFAWDVATDGTLACGSELRIERVPVAIHCARCNSERTIEGSTLPICPVCKTPSAQIVRGRELLVTSMEVIYAASPDGRSAEHSSKEHYAGA
jgi:hydrogenase nickel incorporation protein HypA/HybF